MPTHSLRLLLLLILLPTSYSLADDTDVFDLSMTTPRGLMTSELRLNEIGTGSLKTPVGTSEISDIKYTKNGFEFSVMTPTPMGERQFSYTGHYDGDTVSGTVVGPMGEIPFVGNRRQSSPQIVEKNKASEQEVTVALIDPEKQSPGYLLWHRTDELGNDIDNSTLLLNNNGKVVHTWHANLSGMGTTAYLLDSGGLLRMGVKDRDYVRGQPVAAADQLEITDVTGNAVWSLHASQLGDRDSHITLHHDHIMLPNGNILALIYERLSAKKARAIGWDPLHHDYVWSDGIVEIKPHYETGGYDVVWKWRFADHIVQDKFPDAPNYGVVANHPTRIDAHFPTNYMPLNLIRQHLNSIDYHPDLDQIVVSSFIYNEIWIIDHSSSDLVFRYGNPAVYDQGTTDSRTLLKQHDVNWIDEGLPGAGNLLLMNNNVVLTPELLRQINGQRQDPNALRIQQSIEGLSNVQELALPLESDGSYRKVDNGPYRAELVWLFEREGFFTPFQGGARRLPNGNTLITNTVHEKVLEITQSGEWVTEYTGSAPSYKSFKYVELPAILKAQLIE